MGKSRSYDIHVKEMNMVFVVEEGLLKKLEIVSERNGLK
jgi:hypothetical protein